MDALTVWHQHPGGIAPRLQWWQESAFTMVTTFSVDTSTEVKKKSVLNGQINQRTDSSKDALDKQHRRESGFWFGSELETA